MDFYRIVSTRGKKGIDVYADFIVDDVKDILFRGHAFHAVWDEEAGLWSTKDTTVRRIVDRDIWKKVEELRATTGGDVEITPRTLGSFRSQGWKEFLTYAKSMSDNGRGRELDNRIVFSNQDVKKEDYCSHKLPYPLLEGECPAWDELVSTLYSPEEREKIEWAIGAIVTGDSRRIQKFIVLYGAPGSGKGTIIDVVGKLFEGYCATFNARALASSSNAFATEMFRGNPLVAIQTDGNLSRIEDNTTLNTIISHEPMSINEKFKSSYTARCNAFLFMASNSPVKITDAKSGLIRRLIDVHPRHDGQKPPIEPERYCQLMERIEFELGAIAWHCREVYRKLGKNRYSAYRPVDMMYKTDLFFNFVEDGYSLFSEQDGTTLKAAYARYKAYCEDSGADFRLPMYKFREELKNYFREFDEVGRTPDGKQARSYYRGFLAEKFARAPQTEPKAVTSPSGLALDETVSLLDAMLCDCPAQYAGKDDIPKTKWENVRTRLGDLDTHRTHYLRPPENHIVIDFDLKNEAGEKDAALNLAAAARWPATYAEFSRGGSGVHLHYIYDGDVSQLARIVEENVEVKVFTGGSSLRRRLSRCNGLPVAHISSGLPRKEKRMIDWNGVITENGIVRRIEACLRKEHHGATRPEVDFIFKILEDAYDSGVTYDVTRLRRAVTNFAQGSTHQRDYCLKRCLGMKWRSLEAERLIDEDRLRAAGSDENDIADALRQQDAAKDAGDEAPFTFFDIEVKPNVLLVVWKLAGEGQPFHRMWDPSPEALEDLFRMRLAGYNCRKYDNHILYGRYTGDSIPEVYARNVRIIDRHDRDAMFAQAYGISALDVFDMCSKKQSLKKWEIELGIHHQEHEFPWDQPIEDDQRETLAQYCENDVAATEAVFNARQADWTARKILAALSGLTTNDTTNQHTTRIIFEGNRSPQGQFHYRKLGEMAEHETYSLPVDGDEFALFDPMGQPVFRGYTYEGGRSVYRGEEVGEGGYVYAEPGIHRNVALLDIASMHPSSIVAENLFGDHYTERFRQILQARILIKHGEFDEARHILDGKLAPFLDDEGRAKDLAQALKIAINSVYGLTSAKFDNPFRDIRNKDNIVAKRGALFMVNLKHAVQARGFTVAHIKTDSIKIPEATPEIIQFVMDYGKLYGYNFEHEATYERMCLVNDAVYIARYSDGTENGGHAGQWTATGAQFQQPYVFKTLFSRAPILFDDLCETKSVTSGALYLDFGTEAEPKYSFVGRVGQFCPMKQRGGRLVREKDGKYYAATGTKGYLWQQAELVRGTALEEEIDRGYYNRLVDEALRSIGQYGDAEAFMDV